MKVHLKDITTLVPTRLVRGDRELDGGPIIDCEVSLHVSEDHKRILAKVHLRVEETKGDYTTADQTWTQEVWEAPSGRKIQSIDGPKSSHIRFRGQAGGFQCLFPGEDFDDFMETMGGIAAAAISYWGTPAAGTFAKMLFNGLAGIKFAGNHVQLVTTSKEGPVALFAIVGDTGGDDISDDTNKKDDTRIERIKFAPREVTLSAA